MLFDRVSFAIGRAWRRAVFATACLMFAFAPGTAPAVSGQKPGDVPAAPAAATPASPPVALAPGAAGQRITIKTDLFGVVTAPWSEVASLKSDQPVTVVLNDGKAVAGTVTSDQGRVQVATKEARVNVTAAEVTAEINLARAYLEARLRALG